MLEYYNPNRSYNDTQEVKLTLQYFEYFATYTVKVFGKI